LIVDIARAQESQEKVSRPRLRDEGLLVFPAENDKTFPINRWRQTSATRQIFNWMITAWIFGF
jgi:hypothetical protein